MQKDNFDLYSGEMSHCYQQLSGSFTSEQ